MKNVLHNLSYILNTPYLSTSQAWLSLQSKVL